ncbi:MAG: hypothetical protein Q7J98_07775 [Kiritimatiellia bacterium]|nr:hypothetical protein [Kiritimatiellia bacterium]
MGATQTDKGSALGKWSFITVSILGVALIIALIWSLSRALNNSSVETVNNSSPQGSVAPANGDTTMNTVLSQEEIERRQYEMAEQRTAPLIQAPVAAQAAVIPTKQHNDEVILQKAKTKVNQKLVERMKQYIKDHPNQDNWELEKQIKKRGKQGAQSQ